ncbi:hypothetical protein [Klenkia sp. PcliD-1-E]|uniref:hypothetical protein n=1 Tax=Klenkia sp. PcliD-1-E TaxID=2954492 RepID=UPI0020985FAB|nr:hypothetical protein [Klenkia sp. PcliD-1-E]MCO7219848.1 hypothetical protein [Klenkia sp. PcliD-1-E]
MTAPAKTGLPSNKAVRDLLEGLLGRDVTVAPGAPVTPNPSRPAAVAAYVDPTSRLNAVVLIDLPLSAWCAGALALLPKGGCEDSVEEGELTDVQVEVLHEVVNVAASLFNAGGVTHSRLDRLYAPGEALPGDIAGLTASTNRVDIDVSVAGYGSGSLSVVLA